MSMFDDDEDCEETPINMFSRADDYGGGLEDQRTNQDEMDQLMKPCLDFDDNDEEDMGDDSGVELNGLRPTLDKNQDVEEQPQYDIEKYFSNENVDKPRRQTPLPTQAVFSQRNGKVGGVGRRYSSSSEEEDDLNGGYGKSSSHNDESDDEDDDEFARQDDDPLSLDELDGWMNQINTVQRAQQLAAQSS